ncbi:VC0807 family protein, partial [Candidatus Propionivibrio aalborgensis]|uniref:VC0807 family protein n=1 Tax=Candidatus Propionivibrio aalborgensis TaxID=1860101 RepID=UPI000A47128E
PESLGAVNALLLALAFPLSWGARSLLREHRVNLFAVLGLVSVLLTGGIGLLQLDTQWLAVKEAAIPGLIGLAVAISAYTRNPLVRVILFSPALMDVERIKQALDERGNLAIFEVRLKTTTWMLAGSFFFSAVMNYILATWIVTSPSGTTAFNEELGRLTLLSYPMIALPSMLIMAAALYYLVRTIHTLAGLKLTDALKH